MGRYLRIARITKVRRNKGRLVVRPVDGLPFLLYDGLSAWVVPPSGDAPRHVTLAAVEERDGGEGVVSFEGVRDAAVLSEYQGRFLLAERADLDADALRRGGWSLKGFALDDVTLGRIGRIESAEPLPGQVLLTVQGQYGEVLVPLADDLVVSVDEQAGVLVMDLPRGLVPVQE